MKTLLVGVLLAGAAFGQSWLDNPSTKLNINNHPDIGGGTPNWTSGCPPNNWQPVGGGMPAYNFSDNCSGVIAASSGGTYDTKRNRLWVLGGGHVSYRGNEVYYYDMSTATPTIHAATNPSIFDAATCPEANADGTPPTRHTYGGLAYLPEVDRIIMLGGPNFCSSQSTHTWEFNPNNNTWTDMLPSPDITAFGAFSSDGLRCFVNSTRQKLDCEYGSNLMWVEYDYMPSSATFNQWKKLTNFSTYCNGIANCSSTQSISVAYDPMRKISLAVGGSSNTVGAGPVSLYMHMTDWSIGTLYGTQDLVAQGVTGCSTPLMISTGQYPGVQYDPARQGFAIYPGGGNTVVFFNPTTRQCTSQTFASGPSATPLQSVVGTFGRFQFSPQLGKYVVVNGVDADVFTFTMDHDPNYGNGCSTTVMIDQDCDGYGPGQLQVGPFTDGVIGASNTFSSASYPFPAPVTSVTPNIQSLDTARHLTITGGTGCTPGDYLIDTVSAGNVATFTTSPGIVGSTCNWIITGSLGPDADDMDATVHSWADVLAKWGSVSAFLNHRGYAATRIYYQSPAASTGILANGNDSTGLVCLPGAACDTNPGASALPFLTYAAINGAVRPGDYILLGKNWNGPPITPPRSVDAHPGTSGLPFFISGFPGEQAILDPTAGLGLAKIVLTDCPYIVVDGGITLQNGAVITGGTTDGSATFAESTIYGGRLIQSRVPHRIISHIHGIGGGDGLGLVSGFNGLLDWQITHNIFHDASLGNQHNIYIGSRNFISAMVDVMWNLLYNAQLNNLHENGRMYNVKDHGNKAINAQVANFSPQNGLSESEFTDNISMGYHNDSWDVDTYPGSQPGVPCPGSTIQNGPQGPNTVCPYSQINNLFANNTIVGNGADPCNGTGGTRCTSSLTSPNQHGFVFFNSSFVPTIDLGSNTFRNNIFVNPGSSDTAPFFYFADNGATATTCGPTCQAWAASDTFANNLWYQTSGTHGASIAILGLTKYNCATFVNPVVLSSSGCQNADPKFVAAPAVNANMPSAYDFHLTAASPALHTGTITGMPIFDWTGLAFAVPPSIGAYEFVAPAVPPAGSVGFATITGKVVQQ